MVDEKFDFYSPSNFSIHDLDPMLQRSLEVMNNLDFFTLRHSNNVGNLTARLCDYLKLNSKFTLHCLIAGYVHDIGKLFIPPEITNKNGPLTSEEYEIMKTHTTLGYQFCLKDMNLRVYSDGPWYHHESLNGTGYPRGLKAIDIPYSAQIIRVADEYDAIVTKRQYTTHVNISETLKELIKDAQPSKELLALDALSQNERYGKINPRPLKALFKAVIADTEYEISSICDYADYINNQLKRLNQVRKYKEKMDKSKKQEQKDYYSEGIKMLLQPGESLDNLDRITEEFKQAIVTRNERIRLLQEEIKIIKRLKI
jgi:hypothetical protein